MIAIAETFYQSHIAIIGRCAQVVVPLERNGQTVELLQRKFHVTIPFAYSTGGYGIVFNMPGYGHVRVGAQGIGGMTWQADAAIDLDIWVSAIPVQI